MTTVELLASTNKVLVFPVAKETPFGIYLYVLLSPGTIPRLSETSVKVVFRLLPVPGGFTLAPVNFKTPELNVFLSTTYNL